MGQFSDLSGSIAEFASERDWDQFHSPKNLAMALSVEAAELLEHFQWLTEEQSAEMPREKLERVAQEIADVQIYLIRLADRLGIDVLAATAAKIELNRTRYPADRARGSSKKYTEYEKDPSS